MNPPSISSSPSGAALRWRWCRFDELGVHELQAIYKARQLVFAIEQACIYLDVDGVDAQSWHLAAWDADGSTHRDVPAAYARVVHPGVKYVEPSIGRVITTAAYRGTGLGRELVQRAVAACSAEYPAHGIRISAQARLARFYGEMGFAATGPAYLEDGIPHIDMLRPG